MSGTLPDNYIMQDIKMSGRKHETVKTFRNVQKLQM